MTDGNSIFRHAARVYDAMLADSVVGEWEGLPVRMWVGKYTELLATINVSMAIYSQVKNGLIATGCMVQLQRGARNAQTIYALHHAPDLESWQAYVRSPLNPRVDYATMKEQVRNLDARLQEVERRLDVPDRQVGAGE